MSGHVHEKCGGRVGGMSEKIGNFAEMKNE
jgi:hypothetical protein